MTPRPLQSWRDLNPNCREVARLVSEATERGLGRAERAGLAIHLTICRACRNYRRSVRFLGAVLSAASERRLLSSPEALSPMAKDRIRERLSML